MKLSISIHQFFTLIKVDSNNLDALIAADLKAELVSANKRGEKNILLDLSACRKCDSSGLSALLLGNRICLDAAGKLILIGINSEILELIQLAGFDTQLKMAASALEAEKLLM